MADGSFLPAEYRLTPWRAALDRSNYPGVSSSHAIGQRRSVSKEGDPRRSVDARKGGLRANEVMLMSHSCCGARGVEDRLALGDGGGERRELASSLRVYGTVHRSSCELLASEGT